MPLLNPDKVFVRIVSVGNNGGDLNIIYEWGRMNMMGQFVDIGGGTYVPGYLDVQTTIHLAIRLQILTELGDLSLNVVFI